jgi:hypothetical protein
MSGGNDNKHIDTPIPVDHVNGWPERRGKRVTAWPAVFAKEPAPTRSLMCGSGFICIGQNHFLGGIGLWQKWLE